MQISLVEVVVGILSLSLSPCLPLLSYYIIDRVYIALFAALQQTHRAHVTCDSE